MVLNIKYPDIKQGKNWVDIVGILTAYNLGYTILWYIGGT